MRFREKGRNLLSYPLENAVGYYIDDQRSVMENFELGTVYLVGNDLLDAQHKVVLSYSPSGSSST